MRYVTDIPEKAIAYIDNTVRELNRFVNEKCYLSYEMAGKWIVCMMYAILFHKQNNIEADSLFLSAGSMDFREKDIFSLLNEKDFEMTYDFQDKVDGIFSRLPENMAGWQCGGRCFVEKTGPFNKDVCVRYLDGCTKQDMSAFSYRMEDSIRNAKIYDHAFELYLVRVVNKRLGLFLTLPEKKRTGLYKELYDEVECILGKIMNYRGVQSCEMQVTEHGCELCFFFSKSANPAIDDLDEHDNYYGFSFYDTPLCGNPFLLLYAKELDGLLNEAFEVFQIKE